MTTIAAQSINLNLPTEGQVFRVTGDSGDTIYKVVNGQLQTVASSGHIANTDVQLGDGSIIKAGQPIPGFGPSLKITPLDPSFRGTVARTVNGASQYQEQTGQDFSSLPEFNMADIQTAVSKGVKLGSTSTFNLNNPAVDQNPNMSLQANPIGSVQNPNTVTPPASNGSSSTSGAGTGSSSSSGASGGATHPSDNGLQAILNNPNLTADQKALVQHLYDTISTNDTAQAQKLIAGFNAATAYSDPYFKAQTLIATDALSRALGANEGDLAYQENKLKNTLADLTKSTAAAKDQLSFQHTQELQKLADSYKTDLENTRTNLAASGFSSSSIRGNAEDLLNKQNSGLVESSNRKFSYDTGNLDNTLDSTTRDTNQSLAYLTDKNTQARIDALRKTEAITGSNVLSGLGYSGLLGNIGGSIKENQIKDALGFSNSFVF